MHSKPTECLRSIICNKQFEIGEIDPLRFPDEGEFIVPNVTDGRVAVCVVLIRF